MEQLNGDGEVDFNWRPTTMTMRAHKQSKAMNIVHANQFN